MIKSEDMKTRLMLLFIALSVSATAQEKTLPAPIAPYSPIVRAGNTYYLSGQIPRIPETGALIRGDIQMATKQVMENIRRVLKQNDLDFGNVVRCTVYLKNMDDYQTVNKVYGSYFKEPYPARVAVQVARLPLDADIEISCIAVKNRRNQTME